MRTETLEIACYGLFVGLFGLLVWEGYQHKTRKWGHGPTDRKGWKKLRDDLRDKGTKAQPDDSQWKFSARYRNWWQRIEEANLTGKLPPKKVEVDPGEKVADTKVVGPLKPLDEIIRLRLISADGTNKTRIQVQYKDPNVQVPKASFTPMGDTIGTAGSMVASATGLAYHDLVVGDSLYAPYQDIKFKEIIDVGGLGALFTRNSAEGDGKLVEAKVMLQEMGLSEKHIDENAIKAIGGKKTAARGSSGVANRKWVDVGEKTKQIEPNVWSISRKDHDRISVDYERIMTEEMTLSDYQSRRKGKDGKRQRGVAVKKVSRQMARFGIKSGDVLIALNGKPVRSRTSAIRIGKDEYRRGVRTFQLTFLTTGGKKVTRTYTAPDKK